MAGASSTKKDGTLNDLRRQPDEFRIIADDFEVFNVMFITKGVIFSGGRERKLCFKTMMEGVYEITVEPLTKDVRDDFMDG